MAIFPPSTKNVTDERGRAAAELAGAEAIRRGTQRLLATRGLPSIAEFCLGNGRRADLLAVSSQGDLIIVEVKSSRADYLSDHKWRDYLDFCDAFYFAVDAAFPRDLLPDDVGIICADAYGGDIFRDAPRLKLVAARRKALLIAMARTSASRHHGLIDPAFRMD